MFKALGPQTESCVELGGFEPQALTLLQLRHQWNRTEMNSFRSLILLATFVIVWSGPSLQTNDIDWQAEIFGLYNRWQVQYGAQDFEHVTRDIWVDGFVYISSKSIVLGDFDGLAKSLVRQRKLGQWEMELPHIVSTCDNTAMVWAKIYFKDDKNHTHEGTHAILYEYLYDVGKVKEKFNQYFKR